MRNSLHIKVVGIMLLLILSLMLVLSAFLSRGVARFYLNQFYSQMRTAFADTEFVGELRSLAAAENGTELLTDLLNAYSGELGIEKGTRAYYLLDGETGRLLVSSDGSAELEISPNIVTALSGTEGSEASLFSGYMDVALPFSGGGHRYVICIRDNRQTSAALTREMLTIVIEALLVGFLISVLLSFLLAKTMVRPIQRLTGAARRLSEGDFSDRIPVRAEDEIGILTHTFNDMGARLHDTLQEIESERNKLSAVFLHMTDGITAFSADGILLQFNPAAERLLDRSLNEPGLRYDDLFGDLLPMEEILNRSGGEAASAELKTEHRSLDLFFAPITADQTDGRILTVIHDVTVQRRSETMQREFVANVSHELRTPITNVRSYAETLVDSGSEMPEETVRDFLQVILSESDRMTKLVQDLLVLSRFDADEVEFRMERFDAADSVRRVYEAMRLDAGKHGLKVSAALPASPAWITGDRARIEQVIINLTTNAVRYTPEGGTIEMSASEADGEVRLCVRDTGIGIPAEDIPHIFERFYRVDKARSRAMGGTGLGLSITGEIVKRHGGRIEIESEPGVGTQMTVVLPACPAAAAEAEDGTV